MATTHLKESAAAPASRVASAPRRPRGGRRPWAYLAPAVLLLGGVLGYPVLDGLWTSFNHSILTQPGADRFTGLSNYAAVLTDPVLLTAAWHTVLWGVANLVLQLVLGFALAMLMHQKLAGRAFFRSVVIIPWIVPSVVVALVWRFLLDPTSGPLNQLLLNLGLIDQSPQWLADESTAMPVLILLSTWKWTPLVAVILLAGLQTIPKELHEAAMLDGAGAPQRLRYVIIPGIRTSIALAGLLTVGYSVNNFNGIWMFTRGGPAGATETLTTLAYQYAFTQFDFGRAAAVAMILFAFLFLLSTVYFYLVEGRKR
ncbi:sugar ABC transporter permease [Spongiactinospora gelatinilytica]|uniref:Sugar ABC transporter permease n=1 Tax=Spongiactinospora gelatinilytica TaxID=2666298 RepID=A0A2W2H2X1_9ACTN|nr:sugar ABC transporter permease [Spongiactinospora gelatinilytica]PZG56416.1 sugar ABC transporter permease [Spongiactinospora gelatinilytica]